MKRIIYKANSVSQLILLSSVLTVCVTFGNLSNADEIPANHLVRWMPAQSEWEGYPPPQSLLQFDSYITVNGVALWYWDTGGDGEPVILLHPPTGSAAIWGYQQPALINAGFRVIAYSRRGHYGSDTGPTNNPGTASGDLHALIDHLDLEKIHLVQSGNGAIAIDFALSHPERVTSITLAMSLLWGANDIDYIPAILQEQSSWFKELGPTYRDLNPIGVATWVGLAEFATSRVVVEQPTENEITWDMLADIEAPTLLMGGDADFYQPPPNLLELAEQMARANPEVVILSDSGHSGYWEQPEAFNQALIEFLKRH